MSASSAASLTVWLTSGRLLTVPLVHFDVPPEPVVVFSGVQLKRSPVQSSGSKRIGSAPLFSS